MKRTMFAFAFAFMATLLWASSFGKISFAADEKTSPAEAPKAESSAAAAPGAPAAAAPAPKLPTYFTTTSDDPKKPPA